MMDEWTRAGGQAAEDETYQMFGSRERYREAMARRTHERAVEERKFAEQQVKEWQATVARVEGTVPARGIEWADAGRSHEYHRGLEVAQRKLAAAVSNEDAARKAYESAKRAAGPPQGRSDRERRIDAAERQLDDARARVDALADDADDLERAAADAEVMEAEAVLSLQQCRDGGDDDRFIAACDALDAARAARRAAQEALQAQQEATQTGAHA